LRAGENDAAISTLGELAGDLKRLSILTPPPDPPFGEYAQRLRNVLTAAARPGLSGIGADGRQDRRRVRACHQQYR